MNGSFVVKISNQEQLEKKIFSLISVNTIEIVAFYGRYKIIYERKHTQKLNVFV